ncbi:MAG TPA: DUF4381 family protein [Gemmatimonadaceae bacterium]|nr:DUF4381 family protein [Gemmatimonadaceae bacterium]
MRRLLLMLFVPSTLAAQAAAARNTVSTGVTMSKDTVTVGEPFEVRVRVRAPYDAQINFPDNPDTSGTVQARDPRVIVTTDSVDWLDQTAIYRLSAWDIGSQPVRIGNITVTSSLANSRGNQPIDIASVHVFVRSVLPADSALRVPKPARPLWETKAFPWWLLAVLAALIALGLGVWWWLRRRRRPKPAIVIDPYVRAQKEFTRLDSMGLVDAGERTRFVALVVEILRDYMAARFPDGSLALTSRELVSSLRRHSSVPVERLSRVLHEADLAKFAAFALTEDRARALARDARKIVEQEHVASQPVPEPTERAA